MESSSHILGIGADFTKVRGPVRDIDIGFVGLFRLEGSGLLSPFVAKTKKKTEEQIDELVEKLKKASPPV